MHFEDLKILNSLSYMINPGDTIIDVGACIGDYTECFLEKTGPTGIVYSIELHPDTFNSLCKRFSNIKNVNIINTAVSDIDGEVPFYAGADQYTNNIIGHDTSFNPNKEIGKSNSCRLDTLLMNCGNIKLIKIDVEGADIRVLKGISGIINNVEYILLECHFDEHWGDIKNILLQEYKLECTNIKTGERITMDSPRPYHCLCQRVSA